MSSVFTVFESKARARRARGNRSRSVGVLANTKERRRKPAINLDYESDPATLICLEVSKAIVTNPDISLGTLFKTVANSRRDIATSDTVLLVSAAIMDHLGSSVSSLTLLHRSNTVANYYKKMNLIDATVREMFVTMLMTMNPEFVALIEKAVKVVIERSSDLGMERVDEKKYNSALVLLTKSGELTKDEMKAELIPAVNKAIDYPSWNTAEMENKLEKEQVSPSDSVSVVANDREKIVEQSEILEYNKRRRSGREPEFSTIFRDVRKPYLPEKRRNRMGLGYTEGSEKVRDIWSKANDVLGGLSTRSYNINTGKVNVRRPRVEDFIDSESISHSAMEGVPSVASDLTAVIDPVKFRRPHPTESFLPSSVYSTTVDTNKTLVTYDSLEELKKAAADKA